MEGKARRVLIRQTTPPFSRCRGEARSLRPMCLAPLVATLLATVVVAQERPWPPTYKLRPDEKKRLTAADRAGPDGLVYPDWRWAGVPLGITDVAVQAEIGQFGGVADDGKDDAAALRKAVVAVAQKGGGAILLGEGTYHLDTPVVITNNSVVIRGSGKEKTRIEFRFEVPKKPRFVSHENGAIIAPHDIIEFRGPPKQLAKVRFFVGKNAGRKEILGVARPAAMARTFRLVITGEQLIAVAGTGQHMLQAVTYHEGVAGVTARLQVRVAKAGRAAPGTLRFPRHLKGLGALTFCGDGTTGAKWSLAEDGARGANEIVLAGEPGVHCTDAVALTAPATERWNRLVGNKCKWGEYRVYYFRVEKVDGRRVFLNQAMRYPFPVVDGSYLRRIYPIRRCGVEDLTIAQTTDAWTCGVLFSDAWECWLRRVRVVKAGRMPFLLEWGKWCEVRDCEFDGARDAGGGGTGYVGWQRATDCLMTNVKTKGMRHAPIFEWAASGNVIRDSRFEGSDMQWHAGWTNENLIENCVVVSTREFGGYGYGGWASPPGDVNHGPNGPRNVVYNCDVRSPKAGLFLGGSNEGWLFTHNRFVVGKGPGVIVKNASFDHVFKDNVFSLADATQPLLMFKTADCVGIELHSNELFGGNGELVGGAKTKVLTQGNTIRKAGGTASRPTPDVSSIFDWQRRRRR